MSMFDRLQDEKQAHISEDALILVSAVSKMMSSVSDDRNLRGCHSSMSRLFEGSPS
jgi:hypothetical protein